MKKRLISLILVLMMIEFFVPSFALKANAVTAPTRLWVAPSEENGIPAQIDVFVKREQTGGSSWNPIYTYYYQLYLPGSANIENCFLSWDSDMQATVNGQTYESGSCPIPSVGTDNTQTYVFKDGNTTSASYDITTYQGSANVEPVFIEIDETYTEEGETEPHTIAKMDANKENYCVGRVNIGSSWYDMKKMKGRGNATWDNAKDKKPYNITLDKKINFPGIDSEKTKKWSILAEVLDRSLLCNRSGYYLAYEQGIGQDTASADIWMNGEYQGCYTVTPKTDSFVTKDGFMIEQDNYQEPSVANGGDPQFTLEGLDSHVISSTWTSSYNYITVKKMGDNLLGINESGEVDESPENMEAKAAVIQAWLQDAWDAIRSEDGYNSKGKYYTDYIDIESFAKMYLMHEYVKSYDVCAGSILFHRDGMTDEDKLIAGPLWDLDNAMGSTYSNSYLGDVADRRSAEGAFISNISDYRNGSEYKTSIYKTISKHADFMEEVHYQYNKNRDLYDALTDDVDQMISDIESSAIMNHTKVEDIGNSTGKNNHYYSSKQTLGSGQYSQTYVVTSAWANYAANLVTYITTRSLWFHNQYYDPDFCDHTYEEEVTTLPTCTEPGQATYTCTKCGDTYTESIPATGHSFAEDGVCTVCQFAAPKATISCGEGASVTVYKTQDTSGECVENATFANPRSSDTGLIDISGDGQINFVVSLESGYELVSVTAEPKESYKNLKLPEDTGIVNGYRLTKVKGDLTITVATRCMHDYQAVVTEPTCTERGYTTYTCSNCGNSYIDDYVDALGHEWNNDYSVDQEPTCTEEGSKSIHCSVCDEIKEGSVTVIPKAEHQYGDWTVVKEATCTDTGKKERVCVDCGYKITEAIAAKGHTWPEEYTIDKEATCAEAGSKSIHCSVCNEIKEDSVTVIPKTEHQYGDWTVVKEATCTETGKKEKVCVDCGYKITETIAAKGHTWPEEYTIDKEATCTEAGLESIHCSICNTIKEGSEQSIPKENHQFSDWNITKEATCTSAGVQEKACIHCGNKITETIAAKGHVWSDQYSVDKAATCTAKGLKSIHCSVCGKSKQDSAVAIPEKSHLYKNGKCTSCGKTIQTGWQKKDGNWYYINGNGAKATGWQKISGTWYYFKSNGVMATGWQKIGGTWYYLKSSGAMATGWQKISGTWYYLKSSGAMATGWQKIGGTWYYLKSSGAMATGWQKIGGKWYYFKSSGAMVTGTYTIGGKRYRFSSSGAWIR